MPRGVGKAGRGGPFEDRFAQIARWVRPVVVCGTGVRVGCGEVSSLHVGIQPTGELLEELLGQFRRLLRQFVLLVGVFRDVVEFQLAGPVPDELVISDTDG